MIFSLVHLSGWPKGMLSWFKGDNNKDVWHNGSGGYCSKSDKDEVIKEVDVEDWGDLDWLVTELLDPNSPYGWLNRGGKYYGCSSQAHDRMAHDGLKKNVDA